MYGRQMYAFEGHVNAREGAITSYCMRQPANGCFGRNGHNEEDKGPSHKGEWTYPPWRILGARSVVAVSGPQTKKGIKMLLP